MDKLFYTNEELIEKSAVPKGSDLPAIYFELLEYDLGSLPNGLTLYDIEWTSEGITTDLETAEAKAEKEAQRLEAKQVKNNALNAMVVEVDGMTFQTTESDLVKFNTMISKGGDHPWRLANNTKAIVTSEQLQEVLDIAIPQAIEIENTYTATLPEFTIQ